MFFKRAFVLPALLLILAFTSLQSKDDIISIYAIGDRSCHGTQESIDWCQNVALIEFVNGNFYKIKDNEIAFTIWSGVDELSYTARKYEGVQFIPSYPFTVMISDESVYIEKIVFNSRHQGHYIFSKPNESEISSLQFHKATSEDLKRFIKIYPGND